MIAYFRGSWYLQKHPWYFIAIDIHNQNCQKLEVSETGPFTILIIEYFMSYKYEGELFI